MRYWRRMKKIKRPEKVTNEEVLLTCRREETLLNNTLSRKVNWSEHILRINFLLHYAIEAHMREVKGRRRQQILDDLINRRRYWELKEESIDRKR